MSNVLRALIDVAETIENLERVCGVTPHEWNGYVIALRALESRVWMEICRSDDVITNDYALKFLAGVRERVYLGAFSRYLRNDAGFDWSCSSFFVLRTAPIQWANCEQ
ncbi:hypothetical protein DFH11DRAFT_1727645 [Phellopilus nigrolimitatus]|nr:hypothetical protein DFH11DRAFT_1727645 [Phellopilus nigrolimitatus]